MTTPRQPGWYDDPNDSNAQRYWDGQDWTPRRQRKPVSRETPPLVTSTPPPATRSTRTWLIPLLVILLIAVVVVAGVVLRNVLSPTATGAELVLTGATDPGANAFMPPAAPPPPTNTQPPPTLQPHGHDTTVATQPLPGDRDGLYGGTLNNADSDRDKMITFLGAHPAQAGAFVDALNTDTTLYWSGGRTLTAADIPTYLRELTPALLRLDTRATNHGFDGTHFTTVQSVFQTGTIVLVDAHGVPRARPYGGNPLTAPIALAGAPKLVGTPWPGYHPDALVEVQPSTATITNFVLVDAVTGHPFNRPAGTTGNNDTAHTQPVAPPESATSAPPTSGQAPQAAPTAATSGQAPQSAPNTTTPEQAPQSAPNTTTPEQAPQSAPSTTTPEQAPQSSPATTTPGKAPTTATTAQGPPLTIDGTYLWHYVSFDCGGYQAPVNTSDSTTTITHQGNTLNMGGFTGPLNADGSFSLSTPYGQARRGIVATEGGRTVMRGVEHNGECENTFVATKQ